MNRLADALARLLASGEPRAQSDLARSLECPPNELASAMAVLEEWGIGFESADPARLEQPLELLSTGQVQAELGPDSRLQIESLEVVGAIDSTNSELRRRGIPDTAARVLLAEYQTAGRGRRGRSWTAPYGSGLCLSVAWPFRSRDLEHFNGASLVLGVAVRRALTELGYGGIMLKWPNDLLCDKGKLAGMLVELEADGPWAVFGVGMNWRVDSDLMAAVDQPWVDLNRLTRGGSDPAVPSRNQLAGRVVHHVVAALGRFSHEGLTPFLEEWRQADALLGREVRVELGEGAVLGTAAGVDEDGTFLVATADGLSRVSGGEVKVRSV